MIFTLRGALRIAMRHGYALGAFAPRSTLFIRNVLESAMRLRSPIIVQISANEFKWQSITPREFADTFYDDFDRLSVDVPVVLHLDHTKERGIIEAAMEAGFTSVMIDASEYPLEENIRRTREIVSLAHDRDVSVEAELGRIPATDSIETDEDMELYTVPEEAEAFVQSTGVDALAVSVGTAHGVYRVREPQIDFRRLAAIRARTDVPLVLHGASGVPASMIHQAIGMVGGGVSKVNIATDLEQAALAALGRLERLSNSGLNALDHVLKERACAAVAAVVEEKIGDFVLSEGHADDDSWHEGRTANTGL